MADFLRANAGGTRFLAATVNARQAAPLIIATGAPVLAMGGFIGNMPVVTLPALQALVQSGQVRFVLLDDPNGRRDGRARRFAARRSAAQQAIAAWVREHGVLVDPDRWHPEGETVADGARPMVARLYDMGEGRSRLGCKIGNGAYSSRSNPSRHGPDNKPGHDDEM